MTHIGLLRLLSSFITCKAHICTRMFRALRLSHDSFRRLTNYASLEKSLGVQAAASETRWMIQHVTDRSAATATPSIESLSPIQLSRLDGMVGRRARREPLQYILGSTTFLTLPISCRAPILIPRPETELMVAWTLSRWTNRDYRVRYQHLSVTQESRFEDVAPYSFVPTEAELLAKSSAATTKNASPSAAATSPATPPLRVLDLCSGSGNIALAWYHHYDKPSHVLGVDFNPQAVELSRENLAALRSKNLLPEQHPSRKGGGCRFEEIDLLERTDDAAAQMLPGTDPLLAAMMNPPSFVSRLASLPQPMNQVNLILSNPPYIPIGELSTLQQEVRDWESPAALVSGDDGLDVIKQIIAAAPTLLYSASGSPSSMILQPRRSSSSADDTSSTLLDTSTWDVPELVLELGSASQVMYLTDLLAKYGFQFVTIHHDLAELPRWMAAARRKQVTKKG